MKQEDPFIDIEVEINQTVDTHIHVSDVIYALNRLPMTRRWNAVASILKHIELDESKLEEPTDKLTDEQAVIVKTWIEGQIERFKTPKENL